MSTHNPNPGRSVDERLEFLLQSSESNNEQIGKLTENLDALGKRVDALVATSDRHERDNARFNRVMGAALKAFLEGEGNEQ